MTVESSESLRLLHLLHQAALRLGRINEVEPLLNDAVDLCHEAFASDSCFVYLADRASQELVLRASFNAHPADVGELRMRIGEGITGWVAQQRKPVSIGANAYTDPRFKFYSNLPEDRYEAFLSAPILGATEVLGVINIQHRGVRAHTSEEIEAVAGLGLLLGSMLERVALLQKLERQARRMAEFWLLCELLRHTPALGRLAEQIGRFTESSSVLLQWGIGKAARTGIWSATSDSAPELREEQVRALEGVPFMQHEREVLAPLVGDDGLQGCVVCRYPGVGEIPSESTEYQLLVARQVAIALQRDEYRERSVELSEAIAARKVIERAKGLLQKEKNISEDEAYRLLQQESRRNRRPMVAVAEAFLTSRAFTTV
jgi:GAF domain-containing protein